MRTFQPFALAVALVASAGSALADAPAGAPGLVAADPASFHYSGPVAAPRSVRLAGFNGAISATPSTDGKLDVRAVVRKGNPAQVRVVSREEGGGVAVCVLYEDQPIDSCHVTGEVPSSKKNHHDDVVVDLVARVPAGTPLQATTLNGGIDATGLTGEVRASTLNGDVKVSSSTVREASTLNGDVSVTFGSAPTANGSFHTNNGNVKVELPASTDATIEVGTVQGEVHTSFPMRLETVPGGFGPKSGRAQLGKGGVRIDARSINGDVNVHTRG